MAQLKKLENWQTQHALDDTAFQKQVGQTLTDIKDNHLAHIQVANEKTAVDLWWVKWISVGLASGVGAIVLAIAISLATKII